VGPAISSRAQQALEDRRRQEEKEGGLRRRQPFSGSYAFPEDMRDAGRFLLP